MLAKEFRSREKRVNENFSSVDPSGQPSKAYRLWEWLMDNGEKTREQIYQFDKSYSTVLAKYWRGGMIEEVAEEVYTANPDYLFEDLKSVNRNKDNELETAFQRYRDRKIEEVEKSIAELNAWCIEYDKYQEACAEAVKDVKDIKNKIIGSTKTARRIDKEGSIKIYSMRGARNSVHPSTYLVRLLDEEKETMDYSMENPLGSLSNMKNSSRHFNRDYTETVTGLRDKMSDSLNFYKTDPNAADPKRHVESIESIISCYDKLLENFGVIGRMIDQAIPKLEKVNQLYPGRKPENPESVVRYIPSDLVEDYKKMMRDEVYQEKLYDLIDVELADKVKRECPILNTQNYYDLGV